MTEPEAQFLTSVKVKVLYFAQAREFAGTREEELVLLHPTDVNRLFSELMNAHPKLASIKGILSVLVNGLRVSEDVELKDGDRVALVPPVAGG